MNSVVIAAAGDVLVHRQNPDDVFSSVGPLLRQADLAFGNFEGVLTDRHSATPGSSTAAIAGTANAAPLGAFDVLSLANNHAMDAGYGGLDDTLATLARAGTAAVGAGRTIERAFAPHITERSGKRVAILAVTAVLALGTEANQSCPGIATLRAEDCWAPAHPGFCTPGVPPRIISILNEADWETLKQAVTDARKKADIVIVSVHWGDHTRPWILTDHERLCAQLLAEAKADLVLGHHQHIMRGVEFIDGMPVFYGLGHLVMDMPRYADELKIRGFNVEEMTPRELSELFGEYGHYPRPETPIFPFPAIARNSGIAIIEISEDKHIRCGMVPCLIDTSGIPCAISRKDKEWSNALSFLSDCADKGNLASKVLDKDWTYAGFDVIEWAQDAMPLSQS
jgi:poly-gamma-glutamate synthesis protein (capsule biosynthesis protein)